MLEYLGQAWVISLHYVKVQAWAHLLQLLVGLKPQTRTRSPLGDVSWYCQAKEMTEEFL